MEAQMSY
jgi:hypothetical protein